jgi:hypothetical protein
MVSEQASLVWAQLLLIAVSLDSSEWGSKACSCVTVREYEIEKYVHGNNSVSNIITVVELSEGY